MSNTLQIRGIKVNAISHLQALPFPILTFPNVFHKFLTMGQQIVLLGAFNRLFNGFRRCCLHIYFCPNLEILKTNTTFIILSLDSSCFNYTKYKFSLPFIRKSFKYEHCMSNIIMEHFRNGETFTTVK